MKKCLFYLLFMIFTFVNIITLHAETIGMQWLNEDGTVYDTTTCNAGDDIILPTTPTKRGYTFMGWRKSYIPIEYLKSTGTQYIDTGIEITNDIEFITKIGTTRSNVASIGTSQNGLIIWQLNGKIDFRYFYDVGVITQSSGIGYSINILYDIGFNIQKTSFMVNDFSLQKKYDIVPSGNMFTGSYDIISYLKIYNNNSLVRDFIPVLDENGVACMYDKVTDTFFYNAGTGNFVAGPVINE